MFVLPRGCGLTYLYYKDKLFCSFLALLIFCMMELSADPSTHPAWQMHCFSSFNFKVILTLSQLICDLLPLTNGRVWVAGAWGRDDHVKDNPLFSICNTAWPQWTVFFCTLEYDWRLASHRRLFRRSCWLKSTIGSRCWFSGSRWSRECCTRCWEQEKTLWTSVKTWRYGTGSRIGAHGGTCTL